MQVLSRPRAIRKIVLATAVAVAASVSVSSVTRAATFIYTGPGGVIDNWSTGTNWNAVPVSDPSTSLIFGNGTTTSGTIATTNDVANPFQLNSMLVDYNGSAAITLNIAGNPLEFVNNGAITPTLTINNTGSATTLTIANQIVLTNNTSIQATTAGTFTGGFTGAGNLTKSGAGTVTLSTTASGNTGTDSIASGTLALNFNLAAGPTTNLLGATSSLSMAGVLSSAPVAAMTFAGRNLGTATTNIQTFAGTTFNAGRSLLTATRGSTLNTVTVNLSGITRNTGATVIFTPNAGTNFTTTSANDASGILGAWATIGTSFATNSGTANANDGGTGGTNIVAYTGYIVPGGTSPTIASGGTTNVQLTSANDFNTTSTLTVGTTISVADTSSLQVGDSVSGSFTCTDGTGTLTIPTGATITAITPNSSITISSPVVLSGTNPTGTTAAAKAVVTAQPVTMASGTEPGITDINTLSVTDTANRTYDLGGNTLRFGAAGTLWRDNTADNATTLQNGNITAGGADNTNGELILRNDIGSSGNFVADLAISANLVNNGTGVLTVTKTGAQEVQLTGTNTYTGNTYITQGTLQTTAAEGFGTGSIYVYGGDGGQAYASGATYDNPFFIAGPGPTTIVGGVHNGYGAIRMGNGTVLSGQITLLDTAAIGGGNSASNGKITGQITGSGGLNFGVGGENSGAFITLGNASLTSPNNYTGDTTLDGAGTSSTGHVTVTLGASEQIPNGPGAGNLVLAPGGNGGAQPTTFALNGFNETINGLSSAGTTVNDADFLVLDSAATASTLTLGDNNTNAIFRGEIKNGGTGSLSIAKIGTGDQVLSGANAYSGATTITAGTLEINNQGGTTTSVATDGRLGGATAITISGGQLLLSGSNTNSDRLNDAATINLAGGTFNLNGLSEGAIGTTGVGVLTVSANSHIDFGAGSTTSVVQFDALPVHIPGTSTLTIDDWSGIPNTGGGTEELLFAGSATDFISAFSQSDVVFTGFGPGYTAIQNTGYYEVVAGASTPVPEPASLALLGLGAAALLARRRRV